MTVPALMVANQRIQAVGMQWGFESEGRRLVINARSENVRERRMFQPLLDRQRCVLPASGYYEWRDGDHLRYLVRREDGAPFYLAGLYRADGEGRPRFVILTRAAYGGHARVHSRMPCVLFTREQAKQWIDGTMPPEAFSQTRYDALTLLPQGPEQIQMDFEEIIPLP